LIYKTTFVIVVQSIQLLLCRSIYRGNFMTPFTKTFRQLFVISLLIITFTTTAMHNSQLLQLQNSTSQNELTVVDEPTVVDCSFMLSSIVRPQVRYMEQQIHDEIRQRHNLRSNITDPVIRFGISNTPKDYPPYILLPLKNCIDLNDGDSLQIYDSGESDMYRGKPLLMNGICTKNSNLFGNSFCEQISNAENAFYSNQTPSCIDLRDSLQEFENAGIVTSRITLTAVSLPIFWNNHMQLSPQTIREIKLSPGPNYMTNKKALIQSIHNQNWATYLKNRECGNKWGK
jgi:hypothetical protein